MSRAGNPPAVSSRDTAFHGDRRGPSGSGSGRPRPRRRRLLPPRLVRRPRRQAVRQARPRRGCRGLPGRRRRLRRFRRGRDRAGAQRPRPDRDARPGVVHTPALGPRRPRPRPLRPARRRRTLALRPACDPQGGAGAGRRGPQRRRRGGVLPGQPRRRRPAHPRRRPRHRPAALLRRPRPDPHVRPPHRGLHRDERPGLGELRQRPRRRQRSVRAELHLRRRSDHRGPGRSPPATSSRCSPSGAA